MAIITEVYDRMDRLPRYRKTRIAPTPSGYLHLGNALSFLTTASLAKKTGAKILLRIDDLDRERVRPEFVQDIFDTLNFLGIEWDEGPRNLSAFETHYGQMHRVALYREALQQLRESGYVFACTCSRTDVLSKNPDGTYPGTCRYKDISLDQAGVSWRLHTAVERKLQILGPDGAVTTSNLPGLMQSFVVRKKDGLAAYQLTSLIDDLHFGVDLVVRGADLWPSTLAQLYLASLLCQPRFLEAAFYHHPLLKDVNGIKLSKSAGAQSIRHLRKSGSKLSDLLELLAQSHPIEEETKTSYQIY